MKLMNVHTLTTTDNCCTIPNSSTAVTDKIAEPVLEDAIRLPSSSMLTTAGLLAVLSEERILYATFAAPNLQRKALQYYKTLTK